jgi:RNA-directed DNA polymerase
MDKNILRKWLKCGFIDKNTFAPTIEGTPQGGIISPTLLNLTLKGLESKIASVTKVRDRVKVVIYADDFIVSGKSKDQLENTIKPVIEEFLAERGLELSQEKTALTHIDEGFDFLGHNVRKYNGKLLIKPSKKNIKKFLGGIRGEIKSRPTIKTEDLIRILNPKIRGWANFFRHVVAKDAFGHVDYEILSMLWSWAKRRHPNRPKRWIWEKYFPNKGREGVLQVSTTDGEKRSNLAIVKAADTPIRRHTKIRSDANPYDPAFRTYFEERERKPPKWETKHPTF